MKKFTFLVSLLLIGAFVLAACGGADNSDNNATPGAQTTPGVGMTDTAGTPAVDDGMDLTPAAGGDTGTLDTTPTVEDSTMQTPAAGMDTTPTAEGSTGAVPVTGDEDCRPNTVQGLLDMDVVDASGNQIGDVNNVIVLRDSSAVSMNADSTDNSGTGSTGTNGATTGDSQALATPTVAAGTEGDVTMTGSSVAPQVAYLVIDLENEDNDVVVPFQAFDFNVVNQGVGGTGVGNGSTDDSAAQATPAAGDLQATPAAGDNAAGGDLANEAVVCAITLQNVQGEALSGAPAFDPEMDFSAAEWDNEFRTFWSGQGLSIPATGAESTLGAPVVLGDEFDNIDARDVNGEDLGEVEDFIVDEATGDFQYAVLAAGGFLGIGEKYVPVPMSMVQWTTEDGAEAGDTGYLVLNVNADDWKNAPAFDNVNEIDPSVEGWDTDVQSFWNNLGGSSTK